MRTAAAIIAAAAAVPSVLAWGNLTHAAIGRIADRLLSADGRALLASVLAPGETLETVANWADKIKYTTGFNPWSANLHFVDPLDNPSTSCSYDDDRDCKDGQCIVGAIANYTQRATCTSGLDLVQRGEAVKFLAHFLGDITQPLHVCGRARGGNDVSVTIDNKTINLHAAWDYGLPEKYIKANFGNSYTAFADDIATSIKPETAQTWISKYPYTARNQNNNSLAAIDWATDSDAFDCSIVWPAYDTNPKQDFGGDYYVQAVPVIRLQAAKGGYRLANWINQIAAGSCATQSPSPSPVSPTASATASPASPSASPSASQTAGHGYGYGSSAAPEPSYGYGDNKPVLSGASGKSLGAAAIVAAAAAALAI
nr:hypothetical protein HK105_002539 [Polyrhizophydium stewartii]